MERELARYRSLPAGTQDEALSSRHPRQCRRNTLANANATRDWRIYCDFAQRLIGIARRLYAEEPLGIELKYNGLRTRLNHNRPVSFGVFLGTLPIDESRCEAPHAARSTWQYSVIYLHQRRQVSRR